MLKNIQCLEVYKITFERVSNIGTLRKIEREVLRRKVGNKALTRAYRASKIKFPSNYSNYIPQKKVLTRKGKNMTKGITVIAAVIVVLILLIK